MTDSLLLSVDVLFYHIYLHLYLLVFSVGIFLELMGHLVVSHAVLPNPNPAFVARYNIIRIGLAFA
jgi:hypothetical protein